MAAPFFSAVPPMNVSQGTIPTCERLVELPRRMLQAEKLVSQHSRDLPRRFCGLETG